MALLLDEYTFRMTTATENPPPETASKRRPAPAYLFALGHAGLPVEVTAQGRTWRFVHLFKHDFFAATGLYERVAEPAESPVRQAASPGGAAPRELAVLKVQRTHPLFLLPMKWLGRRIARHEIAIYEALQGVEGIPAFLGRTGPTGFLHAFIPGVDLHAQLPLTPVFFDQLQALLQALHDRGIAYVDANKRENILYGDDGRPWLIDFQISYLLRPHAWWNPLRRWWFRSFARADWYHFYKHKTRLLPAICTPAEFDRARNRGRLHRLHRFLARPLIRLRRRWLSRYHLEKTR
ncbi:MAG TPA: hypothetical protein VH253_04455 [Phycisphaerae bacterium]|nr:hypothetical protein [Phycisphaerae bacterium]